MNLVEKITGGVKDTAKNTARNAVIVAGMGVAALTPYFSQNANAQENLNVEIDQGKERVYENRFVDFSPAEVSNQVSNDKGTTPTLSYEWAFGDGGTSTLQETAHKWDVDQNTTYTVTLDVDQVVEESPGVFNTVAEGTGSAQIEVRDTPEVTSRRSLDDIAQDINNPQAKDALLNGEEGVDYDIVNVSPGEDTILTAVQDNPGTKPLVLHLDNGEYTASFPPTNMMRDNVLVVGNTRHREDILSDGYFPFDPEGDTETTIMKGTFSFAGEDSGIYDILAKPVLENPSSTEDMSRFAVNDDYFTFKGNIVDRAGQYNVRFLSTVTTSTLENNLFTNRSGETAVEVNSGPSFDEKYGINVSNNRFEGRDYFSGTKTTQGVASGVTAVGAEAPVSGLGNIFNVETAQKIDSGFGEELPYRERFGDFGEGRRNVSGIEEAFNVEGAKSMSYGALNTGVKQTSGEYHDGETVFEKDGEYVDVTGFYQKEDTTSVGDWKMYD